MASTGAILLAAGESRRIGARKLKALLPWYGNTLLEHQVNLLEKSSLSPIVVVLGHRHEELDPLLIPKSNIRRVYNHLYKEGKTTSIKAGLSAIQPGETESILMLNVDQPRSPGTISKILEFHSNLNSYITVPCHEGRNGHPIVFSSEIIDDVLNISEADHGLKSVIHKHHSQISWLELDSAEILVDINTTKDYEDALNNYGF